MSFSLLLIGIFGLMFLVGM